MPIALSARAQRRQAQIDRAIERLPAAIEVDPDSLEQFRVTGYRKLVNQHAPHQVHRFNSLLENNEEDAQEVDDRNTKVLRAERRSDGDFFVVLNRRRMR
jgi:hypothetical protein